MRSTHTLTISVPPAMTAQIDRVRRKENRTRSELVREALRSYFAQRYPTVKPTKAEQARITKGRAEIRGDQFVTFDQLLDVLDSPRRPARRQGPKARAR